MSFHDHFSSHAPDYARHRPLYPDALFERLAARAPGRRRAWDCGAGSGQASAALAARFEQVVATDASRRQLAAAPRVPGVQRAVALAEAAPLAPASIDLTVVAQAVHWFDVRAFWTEVRRVGRPGGVIAVWCYDLMHVDAAFDAVIAHLYRVVVGPHWPPERALIEDGYRSLPFPFETIALPPLEMEHVWTLAQLLAYVRTWSAVQRFTRATGEDPLRVVEAELRRCWGDPEAARPVRWPLHVRAGRVRTP